MATRSLVTADSTAGCTGSDKAGSRGLGWYLRGPSVLSGTTRTTRTTVTEHLCGTCVLGAAAGWRPFKDQWLTRPILGGGNFRPPKNKK